MVALHMAHVYGERRCRPVTGARGAAQWGSQSASGLWGTVQQLGKPLSLSSRTLGASQPAAGNRFSILAGTAAPCCSNGRAWICKLATSIAQCEQDPNECRGGVSMPWICCSTITSSGRLPWHTLTTAPADETLAPGHIHGQSCPQQGSSGAGTRHGSWCKGKALQVPP